MGPGLGSRQFNCLFNHNDHVVIGRFGVAVVETKGRSKPESGETKLWASNDKVQFLDGGYDAKPLQQVRANADRIREVLYKIVRDAGNKHFSFKRVEDVPVIPIACYPGWFVDHKRTDCKDVWLTHEKPLIRKLRDEEPTWDTEQVVRLSHLYGEHLRKDRRNLLFQLEDG